MNEDGRQGHQGATTGGGGDHAAVELWLSRSPRMAGREGDQMETPQRSEGLTGRSMTPAAALARHIEWLQYALNAAEAEETRRALRLSKATKKNREKRSARLSEARDEIAELTAL